MGSPTITTEGNHHSFPTRGGGHIGVKDMLIGDGTMRLAVRTPGTSKGLGLGSTYLTEAECVALARLLLPGYRIEKDPAHA